MLEIPNTENLCLVFYSEHTKTHTSVWCSWYLLMIGACRRFQVGQKVKKKSSHSEQGEAISLPRMYTPVLLHITSQSHKDETALVKTTLTFIKPGFSSEAATFKQSH